MPTIDNITDTATAATVDSDDNFLMTVDNSVKALSVAEFKKIASLIEEVTVSSDTYTLLATDQAKKVRATSANAKTFTIPATSGFDLHCPIYIYNASATDITIVDDTGVTSNKFTSTIEPYQLFALNPRATDEWDVYAPDDAPASLIQLATPTLTMSAATTTTIDFSWTNVANEASYYVQIAEDAGFTVNVQTATPAADDNTHQFTGLTINTLHYGRVKAVGDGVTYSDSAYGTDDESTTMGGNEAEFTAWYAEVTGDGGSLTAPQQTAVNDLIADLKAASIFSTHFDFLHVLIGGSEAACKYNLVDPVDADANYRLSFVNSATFASTGVTNDGSTQYINSHWIPNLTGVGGDNDHHISVFARTAAAQAGFTFGVSDGTRPIYGLTRATDDTSYFRGVNSGEQNWAEATTGKGFYVYNKKGTAPNVTFHKDGVQKDALADNGSGNGLTQTYKLVFNAYNNTGAISQYSARELVLFSAGKSFDDTQRAAYETAVADFITALGL